MKYARVTIKKTKPSGATLLSYPEDMDARDVDIILYEDPHAGRSRPGGDDAIEYAVAMVPDDYPGYPGIEVLTEAEAETIIDDWVDNDRSALGVLTAQEKADHKSERKQIGRDKAAIAKTHAEARNQPPPGKPSRTFKVDE